MASAPGAKRQTLGSLVLEERPPQCECYAQQGGPQSARGPNLEACAALAPHLRCHNRGDGSTAGPPAGVDTRQQSTLQTAHLSDLSPGEILNKQLSGWFSSRAPGLAGMGGFLCPLSRGRAGVAGCPPAGTAPEIASGGPSSGAGVGSALALPTPTVRHTPLLASWKNTRLTPQTGGQRERGHPQNRDPHRSAAQLAASAKAAPHTGRGRL